MRQNEAYWAIFCTLKTTSDRKKSTFWPWFAIHSFRQFLAKTYILPRYKTSQTDDRRQRDRQTDRQTDDTVYQINSWWMWLTERERVEIWSEKESCSSKMKPRLRAERVVLSEDLCILANCLLSPMSINSVLEELRVKKIGSHPRRDLLESILKVGSLCVVTGYLHNKYINK